MLMLNDIIGMDHKSYNLVESTHLRHLKTNCVVFYTVTCTKLLRSGVRTPPGRPRIQYRFTVAVLAQLVEQWIVIPWVVGSSPIHRPK